MDVKLKTVTTLVTSDDLVYPFSLQAVGDVYIHRLKNSIEIVRLQKSYNNRESRIQLSSIKTEKPTQVIQLNVDEKSVFDNADWNQKNLLMLNSYLFPNCTLKNTHYIKSRLTTEEPHNNSMLAALTTAGVIELYRYYLGSHQLFKLPVHLAELRKEGLSKKAIKKYNVLVESYNQVAFTNFEWCPTDFEAFKLLLTITKSNEIVIYRIQEDKAITQFKKAFIDVSSCVVKWTHTEINGHNLYMSMNDGSFKRFSLKVQNDGQVTSVNEIEEIKGKIQIPASHIHVEHIEDTTVITCCKNHSLEIICHSGRKTEIITKRIGVSITGFESIGDLEYFITTLNSNVFYLVLGLNVNNELEIQQYQKVDILLPSNEVNISTNMSYYGIAASKNKIFVYISSSPRRVTDHLIVKQPVHLSVHFLLKNDPYEILKNNESFSLTNYADCVEAVRLQGLASVKTLEKIESMYYEIKIDDAFVYYLKMQLLVVNTKVLYYFTRSQTILDIFKSSQESLMELIKVVKTYTLLESLVKAGLNSELNVVTIRAMRNFLIGYTRKYFDIEQFKYASETLKPTIMELIEKCKTIKVKAAPEICQFCEELILEDEEVCTGNHQMKRCAITNLQIPLECKNFCTQCLVSVTTLDNLTSLFGNSTAHYFCPFCDGHLTFFE